MIHYTLRCEKAHHFDEWFDNSRDYENKVASGAITCPACGDTRIDKAIMAPNVSDTGRLIDPPPPPSCSMGGCRGGMCGLD